MRLRLGAWSLLGLCITQASRLTAQEAAGAATAQPELARPWLGDRYGVTPLERALVGGDSRERERALTRLGTLSGARAVELLLKALEPSGAAQSARERLLCVRALAAHVVEAKVREALVRVMTGISVNAELREPLYGVLRDSAALALASSGHQAAFDALGKALRQPGRVAQAAASALSAHPPRDLAQVLTPLRTPTPELVWVLEALGDERAFEALRDIVRRGGTELGASAALALTRLGNFETVELARHWSRSREQNTSLLVAAAEILALAGEPDGARLTARLLQNPDTRHEGLKLAAARPEPDLTRPLIAALQDASPSESSWIITALGRSRDPRAAQKLGELARGGDRADFAAYALALSSAERASHVLGALLLDSRHRRRAARAAILRRAALGAANAPEGLDDALEVMLTSASPADRAVAAFGLALQDTQRAHSLLGSRDALLVQAAARAAPFAGAARAAGSRVGTLPPGPTRSQLALSLVDPGARALVPTRVLLELIAEAGPAAPLSAFALGERDSETTRAHLLEYLASPDPQLRGHVAQGLGGSTEPSAIGLLETAYRFEVDPDVRHAIALGLARRPEAVRRRTLELAARLDPNARVRHTARLALEGIRPSPFSPGVGTVWLVLEGPQGPGAKAVQLAVPGGMALPLLADPDGVGALVGLPAGPVGLRLARDTAEGKALPKRW